MSVGSGPAAYRRVLGIDPGTRRVGYAVVDTDPRARPGLRYVECGVLRLSESSPIHARLFEMAVDLREIIGEFLPQELAIETAFHGKNAASALKLAEARGAVKLVAVEAGLAVSEYSPSLVKRSLTGAGQGSKPDVQQRVTWICGLEQAPPADAADALAVAICHAQQLRGAASTAR